VVLGGGGDGKGVGGAIEGTFLRGIVDAISKGVIADAIAKGAVGSATAEGAQATTPLRLLIDGELSIDDWTGEQHTLVDGDATYLSIAAASILAKVHHDKWVQAYCDENPQCAERYGLRSGKGYGTQVPREGLQTHGAHELHRRTFIGRYVPADQGLPRPNVEIKGYRRNYFTLKTIQPTAEGHDEKGAGNGAGAGARAGAETNHALSVPDKCIIRL